MEAEGAERDPMVPRETSIRDGLLGQQARLTKSAAGLERRQIDLQGAMPYGIDHVSGEPLRAHLPSVWHGHGETGRRACFGRRDRVPLVASRWRGASGVPDGQPAEEPGADKRDCPQPG